jgi:hypothetical protein
MLRGNMQTGKFYCFTAGEESQTICRDITREVSDVDWCIEDFDLRGFTHKVINADLIIIVANLNSFLEASNVEQMLKVTESLGVPTLLYSTYPIKHSHKTGEQGISQKLLGSIITSTVLLTLDNDSQEKSRTKITPFIQHYTTKGFNSLSVRLIIAIKAIVEPVARQELIGVDFADYCLVFADKGLYQTKLYTQEGLSKVNIKNDSWLRAKVITATVFLPSDNALDSFSVISTSICNMVEGSNTLLLITPVIAECTQGEPAVVIIYNGPI